MYSKIMYYIHFKIERGFIFVNLLNNNLTLLHEFIFVDFLMVINCGLSIDIDN